MSDHNYDEDHWLAPTNPRTAFALHHAAALGDVDEVMRLLAGCDRAHIRNCNQTAKGVDPVRAHPPEERRLLALPAILALVSHRGLLLGAPSQPVSLASRRAY